MCIVRKTRGLCMANHTFGGNQRPPIGRFMPLRLVKARRRGLHDANEDWAYRKGCWILDLNGLCRRGIGSMI